MGCCFECIIFLIFLYFNDMFSSLVSVNILVRTKQYMSLSLFPFLAKIIYAIIFYCSIDSTGFQNYIFLKYLYPRIGALDWLSFWLMETQQVMLTNLLRSCKSMTPVQLSCAENWQLTTLNSCLRSTRTRRILFFSLLDMTCNKFNAKMLVLKSSTRKISLRRVFCWFSVLG